VRIVCLADTHGRHQAIPVPEGDVLVHAGDLTMRGDERELAACVAWLVGLPHPHKVVIAGNHDWLFERQGTLAREMLAAVTYLQDSGVTIDGLRVWGSPWQPWFMDWAFNLRRGGPLRAKWNLIPEGTEVLVTHGPPHGILDQIAGFLPRALGGVTGRGEHVGCEELRAAVGRLRPRLHVFGHIHEGYGREERNGTTFVNASSCDAAYRPVNAPVVVDL
jgi:predicted phosphodiesterase